MPRSPRTTRASLRTSRPRRKNRRRSRPSSCPASSRRRSIAPQSPTLKPRRSWLEALALHRPELRAWALYDWANSAFFTTVVAAVFPIYFRSVAADGKDWATERFAFATTVSMLASALLAPVLGTLADVTASKKRFLGVFLGLGVLATAAMFWIERGDWMLALVLFGAANLCISSSFVFYDSLLPTIATPDELDRVSTAGYALGYLGGGALLALNLAWITKPAWFGLASGKELAPSQATLPVRLAFLSVAVWWLVFAIPLFLRVREPRSTAERTGSNPLAVAFTRLRGTFSELARFRQALLLLVAFLIFNDGIGTIIRMAAIYGEELHLDRSAMIAAILIVQFVGIPFAFLFGALAGRIGAKRSILIGLVVYLGICLLAWRMSTTAEFFALAVLVAAVQGGCQALSRSLFASMIPRDKSGEFFGLFAVLERFAGVLGPAAFFAASSLTGSSRAAIVSLVLFFIVGGALLTRVDVAAGRRAAREADELAGAPQSVQ